jgi:hypothetical protein
MNQPSDNHIPQSPLCIPHLTAPLFSLLPSPSSLFAPRRRVGKIAKLPPTVRDQINVMLQDGVPYAQIIARLGDAGKALNKDNLSRWRKADHQDWLKQQLWLQATRDHPDLANHPVAVALAQFDPVSLNEELARHPAKITRVYNFVAKLSEKRKNLAYLRTPSLDLMFTCG